MFYVKRMVLLAALVVGGCDGWGDPKLECHDEAVQATVKKTITDAAAEAAVAEGAAGEGIAPFLSNNPLSLDLIVEKARTENGGISCAARLSVNVGGTTFRPEGLERFLRQRVSTLAQFAGIGLARDKIERTQAVIEFLPSVSNDVASWSIKYDVDFTSDKKQFVTNTEAAGGYALYLGYFGIGWTQAYKAATEGSSPAAPSPAVATAPIEPAAAASESLAEDLAPVIEPSFDCQKAATASELMICGDKSLADADVELARQFKMFIAAHASPGSAREEQRAWIRNVRDACADAGCMLAAYNARLAEVRQ